MGRQYSTETNEALVQQKSGLFDKINTELQWNFVKNNPGLYIAFILICLIAFPIQYAVVPTLLTQFATKMTKDIPRNQMLRNVWSNLKTKNVAGIIAALIIMWIIVGACFMGRETIGLKIFPDIFIISDSACSRLLSSGTGNSMTIFPPERPSRVFWTCRVCTRTNRKP